MQRALVQEAMGKLKAAEELFGIEDGAVAGDSRDYDDFRARVQDLDNWIFGSSAIA